MPIKWVVRRHLIMACFQSRPPQVSRKLLWATLAILTEPSRFWPPRAHPPGGKDTPIAGAMNCSWLVCFASAGRIISRAKPANQQIAAPKIGNASPAAVDLCRTERGRGRCTLQDPVSLGEYGKYRTLPYKKPWFCAYSSKIQQG